MKIAELCGGILTGYLGHRTLYGRTEDAVSNANTRALVRYGLGSGLVLGYLAVVDRRAVAVACEAFIFIGLGVVVGYLFE